MNSRTRKKFIPLIAQRHGGIYCFIGGEELTLDTLVIDHLDGNNNNNSIENLCFLCISMNAVKNPRGRDKRRKILSPVCGNIFEQICENGTGRPYSPELKKNLQAEPDFKHWVFARVINEGKIIFDVALDAGAAFARCSQETARRYLKKEASEVRLYQITKDQESGEKIVVFRPEWAFLHEKRQERKKMNEVLSNWKELMSQDAFSGLKEKALVKS